MDGGERWGDEGGVFDVVEAGDAKIFRGAKAARFDGTHEQCGGVVVRANERIGLFASNQAANEFQIGWVANPNPSGAGFDPMSHQRLAKPGNASNVGLELSADFGLFRFCGRGR